MNQPDPRWAETGLRITSAGHRTFTDPVLAGTLARDQEPPIRESSTARYKDFGPGSCPQDPQDLAAWIRSGHTHTGRGEPAPALCWCWHHYFPPQDPAPELPSETTGWGRLALLAGITSYVPITSVTPAELLDAVAANPLIYTSPQASLRPPIRAAQDVLGPGGLFWLHEASHPNELDLIKALYGAATPLAAAEAAIEAVNQHWLFIASALEPRRLPHPGQMAPNPALQAGTLYALTRHFLEIPQMRASDLWSRVGLHRRPDGHRHFSDPALLLDLHFSTSSPRWPRHVAGGVWSLISWMGRGHYPPGVGARPPALCWCWHNLFPPVDTAPTMPDYAKGGWDALAALSVPGTWVPLTTASPDELIATQHSEPDLFTTRLRGDCSPEAAARETLHALHEHWLPAAGGREAEEGQLIEALYSAETPRAAAEAAIEAVNRHWLACASQGPAMAPPNSWQTCPKPTLQAAALFALTRYGARP